MTFLYLALVIQFDKSVHFSFQPLSLLSLRVQSQSQVVTFFSQMFIRRLVKTVIQIVLRVFFAQKLRIPEILRFKPFISPFLSLMLIEIMYFYDYSLSVIL